VIVSSKKHEAIQMELVDWSEWSETIQAAELQYLRMLKLLLQFRHCSLEKYGHA